MKWYKDLYLSDNMNISSKSVRFMVDHGIFIRPLYLIVLFDFPDGQLEILNAGTLKLPAFFHGEYQVIGAAKGYYHARNLIERIYADVYEKTGTCQVKDFFQNNFDEEWVL